MIHHQSVHFNCSILHDKHFGVSRSRICPQIRKLCPQTWIGTVYPEGPCVSVTKKIGVGLKPIYNFALNLHSVQLKLASYEVIKIAVMFNKVNVWRWKVGGYRFEFFKNVSVTIPIFSPESYIWGQYMLCWWFLFCVLHRQVRCFSIQNITFDIGLSHFQR